MNNSTFTITGRVVDKKTEVGIPKLKVEAWDKNLVFNGMLGSNVTDKDGGFQLEFSSKYFSEIFGEKLPDIYFKIFKDRLFLLSTEKDVVWNVKPGEFKIVIPVDYRGKTKPVEVFPLTVSISNKELTEVHELENETEIYIKTKLNEHFKTILLNKFKEPK